MTAILLKNAGGFSRWERAIVERVAQSLSEYFLETKNENAPDSSLLVIRPKILQDNATIQDIALWEARERQYEVIHNRIQKLLEFMAQTMKPKFYERLLFPGRMEHITPTGLYRAVKKTLQSSSKSSESELQTKIVMLERIAKTSDIDVWLKSSIQIEALANKANYS